MTGSFYIDGKDAYAEYRIAATGYNELVCFPPLKSVDGNDWAEEDGQELDLAAPMLDTRELSIKFAFQGKDARFGAFVELLSDGAYHDFEFTDIEKSYRLRLVSQPNLANVQDLGTFSLQLADDFPLLNYTYVEPQASIRHDSGYELDGRNLSNYGVAVLQGTEAEILKSPAVKKNLLQNINSQSGATYDGKNVIFQSKEVKLSCLLRASTLEELWRSYNALLFDLVRPNERGLYVEATGYEYECHYKSCSVKEFKPAGKIWLEFSLVFAFTSFRVDGDEFLLTTEEGELLVTEEDEVVIDLGF